MIYAIQSSQPPGGETHTRFSVALWLMVWNVEVMLYPNKLGDVTASLFTFSLYFVFLFKYFYLSKKKSLYVYNWEGTCVSENYLWNCICWLVGFVPFFH